MANYPGLHEHVGLNGYYKVNRAGENLTIDIYLRSVPAFEEKYGKLILPDPVHRVYPDISFLVEDYDGYWSIVSMKVPSFSMDGVNEFLSVLLQYQEDLKQPDDLLPLLQMLLNEEGARWGQLPVDLEAELGTRKLSDTSFSYHPGI